MRTTSIFNYRRDISSFGSVKGEMVQNGTFRYILVHFRWGKKIETIKTMKTDYAAVARKMREIEPLLKQWVGL